MSLRIEKAFLIYGGSTPEAYRRLAIVWLYDPNYNLKALIENKPGLHAEHRRYLVNTFGDGTKRAVYSAFDETEALRFARDHADPACPETLNPPCLRT